MGSTLLSSTMPDMSSAVRKSGTPANFSPVVKAISKFLLLSAAVSVLRPLKSKDWGKKLCMRAQKARPLAQDCVKSCRGEREVTHSWECSLSYPDVDLVILSGPALTPDEDGLHLRGQTLLPGDAELEGQAGVCGHAATLAVPDQANFTSFRHRLRSTHGFSLGVGFLTSSISPDMFLRKRLWRCFSSMSFSLRVGFWLPPTIVTESVTDLG